MARIQADPVLRDQRAYRVNAIDVVRGLIVVVMAIDHVRDFFMVGGAQDPVTNPTATVALFMTRWITHFCAPVFVLFAGTSAGLMTARKTPAELARFLFTRGVWLVFIECTVISMSATFAPTGIAEVGGALVVVMQVIWAIGASMIVLSAAQGLGRRACFAAGVAVLLTHNLLDRWWPVTVSPLDEHWPAWVALHAQMAYRVGPVLFVFIYPLLPWIAVMLVGFAASTIFERPPVERNRTLLRVGLGLTAAFIVIRAFDAYGDPNPWRLQPAGLAATVTNFVNTTKYPPSLDFLLMTLGPAAILCAYADRFNSRLKDILITFGRVPFAFYVAHFILIHTLSVCLGVMQGFAPRRMLTVFLFYPEGYGVALWGVYAVWAFVIVVLYPFCRWVTSVKRRRRDWWLSYV
jgi:uncharacterized membrane protein